MNRLFVVVAFVIGLALVGASLRFVLTRSTIDTQPEPTLNSPPRYGEVALNPFSLVSEPTSVGPGLPSAGGGCGTFRLTSLEFYPLLIQPTSGLSVGNSFLVGVRIQVRNATAERRDCVVERGAFGVTTGTDSEVQKVALQEFTGDERRRVQRLPVQASLFLTGAEYAPKEPVGVSEEQPAYWSVRPSSAGGLKGWVRIEPRLLNLHGEPQQSDIQVSVAAAEERQTFSAEVASAGPSIGYILSVLGSILGTLLASLPAWLAWHDKRKGEGAKDVKGPINLP